MVDLINLEIGCMTVNYDAFIEKYAGFTDENGSPTVDEPTFDLFLADAFLEIDLFDVGDVLFDWMGMRDRATELLTAHLLSKRNPGDKSAADVESFRVDDRGYEVKYSASGRGNPTKRDDYSSSWYGIEYQRIIGLLQERQKPTPTPQTVQPTTSLHSVRGSRVRFRW